MLDRRRPGTLPGRRLALAVAFVLSGLLGVTGARADTTVANVTVYPGSGNSTPVTYGELSSCSPYPYPVEGIGLYGLNGANTYKTASTSNESWSLYTILTCGLSPAATPNSTVQVATADGSLGTPLTLGQLNNPSQYQDPDNSSNPGELPVVSVNGTGPGATVQYIRPWMGGSDDNYDEWVPPGSSTVDVAVFENGYPPLSVTISPPSIAGSVVTFGASVQGAPSSVTWHWTFGDGATSDQQNPVHPYGGTGTFDVNLVVTSGQQGGYAHTKVTIGPQNGGGGSTPQTGGPSTTPTGSPSGPTLSIGNNPGSAPGKHRATAPGSSPTKHRASGSTPAHPRPGASRPKNAPVPSLLTLAGAGAGSSTAGTNVATAPKAGHNNATNPARNRGLRLVDGRLIGSLTPRAPDQSPLVHVLAAGQATAPPVRRAVVITTLAGLLGGLAIAALLALGAGRELAWRGRRRPVRFGS